MSDIWPTAHDGWSRSGRQRRGVHRFDARCRASAERGGKAPETSGCDVPFPLMPVPTSISFREPTAPLRWLLPLENDDRSVRTSDIGAWANIRSVSPVANLDHAAQRGFAAVSRRSSPVAAAYSILTISRHSFDVMPDDQHFLMIRRRGGATYAQMMVLENWAGEARAR